MSDPLDITENLSYQLAFEELKSIVYAIESGEIEIDKLSEHIERASKLIYFCKNKLRNIEDNLKKYDG